MDREEFLSLIKYDLEFIFSYGVDVINVRFYEDNRYYAFYVNEFEEEFAYFSKPSWGDSDYQIIKVKPRKYSLLIDGRYSDSLTFTGYEGWGGIKKLLETLLFYRAAFGHSDEIYEKGIFSGTSRDSKPLRKDQKKVNAASTNVGAIKKAFNKNPVKGEGLHSYYGMSYNAMEAFAKNRMPRDYVTKEWLRKIDWKGTREEVLNAPMVNLFRVAQEWHHMVLGHGEDSAVYQVNFYDKDSLDFLVRGYQEQKENISNIQDAINFGVAWWDWEVSGSFRGGYTVSFNEKVRFRVELTWDEEDFYDVTRFNEGSHSYLPLRKSEEKDVIIWILNFIDKIERNEEI